MKVQQFVNDYKAKKIINSKINPNAITEYIISTLEVKKYIPLKSKQEIAKTIINKVVRVENGYKVVSSVEQFLDFVMSMLVVHTNLEISDDPYDDYDMLCENELLQPIIDTFRNSYSDAETILKMELSDELQTNATPAIVAQFLDSISKKLDSFSEILKDRIGEFDLNELLDGTNISNENADLIKGIFNKK